MKPGKANTYDDKVGCSSVKLPWTSVLTVSCSSRMAPSRTVDTPSTGVVPATLSSRSRSSCRLRRRLPCCVVV